MIPSIGVMIGLYIITRMISLLTRKETRKEASAVTVCAVFTITVTVLVIISLLTSGTSTPPTSSP